MEQLILRTWFELEAAERGIKVTQRAVRRAFRRAKRQAFPTDAAFRRHLKETGQTETDIRDHVRADPLVSRIRAHVMAKAKTRKGRQRLIDRFARRFDRKWHARTILRRGLHGPPTLCDGAQCSRRWSLTRLRGGASR